MTTQDSIPPDSLRICLFHLDGIFVTHPPYSLDQVPSDYHLFNGLEEFMGKQQFSNDEEFQKAVKKQFWEAGGRYTTRVYKIQFTSFKNALISTAIMQRNNDMFLHICCTFNFNIFSFTFLTLVIILFSENPLQINLFSDLIWNLVQLNTQNVFYYLHLYSF